MALLEIRGLTKIFGGLTAVNELDFDVSQGELLGLIGPNGAGKTTLFNLISGVLKPTRGKVLYKGKDITGLKTDRIASLGVVRTFQATSIFPEMTVFDNVVVAHHLQAKAGLMGAIFDSPAARKDNRDLEQKTMSILDYMGLSPFKDELAKNLPHGHHRLLGIALALATNPELLLLDEPITGMNPEEVTAVMGRIESLWEKGITMVVVEHNMKALMKLSRRIVVMNFGRKIAEGTPEEIQHNKEVIEAYLGTE
jgi:branched-chain amino acid transport system ATP-binding protein